MADDRVSDAIKDIRELAWEWDPIGVGQQSRPFAADEYDCLVEAVVPLLSRGGSTADNAESLAKFVVNHMGFTPSATGMTAFVQAASERWSRR